MAGKFIPNGDLDFATMAHSFARKIAKDPGQYHVSQEDSDALSAAVQEYRDAFTVARRGGSRSQVATAAKEQAREKAERIVRRLGHLIRVSENIDSVAKTALGLGKRAREPRSRTGPCEPPRLKFKRALHEGTGVTPMHELEFRAQDYVHSRPVGAVRVELFVDLVPPEEPIPGHPGVNNNSRPWYLRSYTRSPIRLTPPIARLPMRVVYWARWADSQGNVGPFSATAAAWIEGGSHALLPGGTGMDRMGGIDGAKSVALIETNAQAGPAERDVRYRIAVIEAHVRALIPNQVEEQLPRRPRREEPERRQIEGPAQSEAA